MENHEKPSNGKVLKKTFGWWDKREFSQKLVMILKNKPDIRNQDTF